MEVLQELRSEWSQQDGQPLRQPVGRFEGEIQNLVVLGEVPKEINGTFYRVIVDPSFPLYPGNPPIEGDGNVSAFRIHDGLADMKIRYVDTERLLLERKANRRLFGLYRNPFTHHPCVRAAVDSTANTNIVHWAGKLLALKEVALPYSIDPDTLETLQYDPFDQVKTKTFTAHPKVDPFTNELVCFGYEAKGLATPDVVVYTLDEAGQAKDEQWIKSPWVALIHDCAITQNWIILMLWPFEATSIEEMKGGSQHWQYKSNRPASFLVIPRRKDTPRPDGWGADEGFKIFEWENCVTLHAASAWEDGEGRVYLESSRIMYNPLPHFDANATALPSADLKADFVRWELDLRRPSNSKIADPIVILALPSEFPRIDERFMSQRYSHIFLAVVLPESHNCFVPVGLNGLCHLNTKTGNTDYFDPGEGCHVAEPVFVPRSADAVEGDGWVMAVVDRKPTRTSELVVLDTQDFSKPVAVVEFPFMLAEQIHGNWVDQSSAGPAGGNLVRAFKDVKISGRGALCHE